MRPNRAWVLIACFLLSAACCPPGSVKPTVKIGLSAPFEGRDRDLGYEVLYAVRLAVRERNEAGGVGGGHPVELVALNDFGEGEEAGIQARKMAVDPDVWGVLGGWSSETAEAAAPVYAQQGLALVTPPREWPQGEIDPGFAAAYEGLSGGVPPGPTAAWAYDEAQRMLDAFDEVLDEGTQPAREGVRLQLGR
jgi:hypothetical protein